MLSRKLTINEGLCSILTGTFLEMISNSSAHVVPPSFPHTEEAHVMREHKSIVYWGVQCRFSGWQLSYNQNHCLVTIVVGTIFTMS
jgi:hypothetical protein